MTTTKQSKMFRRNSLFTPLVEETEYLEGVRKHALEAFTPIHNEQDAGVREDVDEALRLAREAHDDLDAQRRGTH